MATRAYAFPVFPTPVATENRKGGRSVIDAVRQRINLWRHMPPRPGTGLTATSAAAHADGMAPRCAGPSEAACQVRVYGISVPARRLLRNFPVLTRCLGWNYLAPTFVC